MSNANAAAEALEAEEPVLNQALLDQYKSRKSNLFERLINAYLDEAPKFFQSIRTSTEASDFNGIRMSAHALKSCSYNLGAVRLSKICQDIETAALAQDMALVQAAVLRIGPECFDAEQALRSELYHLKNPAVSAPAAQSKAGGEWY